MISEDAVISANSVLTQVALRRWIELGWVVPAVEGQESRFDMIDVARIHLIRELHVDLGIEEDTMTMVLSLLDQLYAVRRTLSSVMAAVAAQPADVRGSIATLVGVHRGVRAGLSE